MPPRPTVALFSLGGTIAMAGTAGGPATPQLGGEQIVRSVTGLTELAEVRVTEVCNLPGASLSPAIVVGVVDAARAAVRDGADGVVVTQGTDTIEETAFLVDLFWGEEAPIVVTGAMRTASELGADGARNVAAAVVVAAAPHWRGLGCLVLLGDAVHGARFVCKTSSVSPAPLSSTAFGPFGAVVEGRPRLLARPAAGRPRPLEPPESFAPVGLVEATLGASPDVLELHRAAGYAGLVVNAFGAGHLSESWARAAIALAADVAIVLASRTEHGGVLASTYGFFGSETHLLDAGLISAGMLDGRKARLLLAALIGAGFAGEALRAAFAEQAALSAG